MANIISPISFLAQQNATAVDFRFWNGVCSLFPRSCSSTYQRNPTESSLEKIPTESSYSPGSLENLIFFKCEFWNRNEMPGMWWKPEAYKRKDNINKNFQWHFERLRKWEKPLRTLNVTTVIRGSIIFIKQKHKAMNKEPSEMMISKIKHIMIQLESDWKVRMRTSPRI